MSYIIKNNGAFVNIKLTDTGRRKLAQGQLNFSAWSIGDSEINYDREDLVDTYTSDPELSASTRVVRPMDLQPNIKTFITKDGTTALNTFTSGQISTIKAIVNNKATERGFFSGDTTHSVFLTQTGSTYMKAYGTVNSSSIMGGTSLVIGTGHTYSVGDFILLKLTNDTLGNLTLNDNTIPTPNLWYKIQSTGTTTNLGDTIIVDRSLPNFSANTTLNQFFIYPNAEINSYYGSESLTAYWNTNTLNFESCCDITCADVPVWNMNNVWCENIAGMESIGITHTPSTPYQSYEKFGSQDYIGFKYPYMEISCDVETSTITNNSCNDSTQSTVDETVKSMSIIHYSNNNISNLYGEFFFIDNDKAKTLSLYLPDLMWHRRDFTTETGDNMGMKFIASGITTVVGTSQVEYIDLIEDSTYIPSTATSKVVGRVLPQLKMVVLTDDELIAAMSYKSNRNWTLPSLTSNLKSPSGGPSNGFLQPTETIWMTYTFENDSASGLTTTLPCQKYTKLYNGTSNSKDVEFKISDLDLLPYMRKTEKGTYDGMGFHADKFKVLYQVTTNGDRPSSDKWYVHDFTSTAITQTTNATIDPLLLETQTPSDAGFLISNTTTAGDTFFSIMTSLNMTPNTDTSVLQFGDERFFYGNLDTYIGANIYKTTFAINVAANEFTFTSNPSRSSDINVNRPDLKISEIGIYDTSGDLVMIGKLSKPIRLASGKNITIELSMDF